MTYDISEAMVGDLVNEAKRMIRDDALTEGQVSILTLTMKNIVDTKKSLASRYYWMKSAVETVKNM